MRLATREQSREIDKLAQTHFSLPAEILMESAGALASRELELSYFPEMSRGHIGIVCGPGNNGGDGLVLARHLHSAGRKNVVAFVSSAPTSALVKAQLDRATRAGVRVVDMQGKDFGGAGLSELRACNLVVDALFGTGLSTPVRAPYDRVMEMMNSVRCPIVSLDVPSGLDCNSGVVLGLAVKAQMTIAFGLAKPGFFVQEGPSRVGKLRVLSIGFPRALFRSEATTHFAFNERLARRYLPKRREISNKSNYGHLGVIAGQSGTWGAALLACGSGFRIGAGYVSLASFENPKEFLPEMPEVLTHWIQSFEKIPLTKWEAIVVGPGLGVNEKTAELLRYLKANYLGPVVVDADAITVCAQEKLFPLPASWVLTPHAGELARLLKVDAGQIERNRYEYAQAAAKTCGCYVLLKGYRTVVAEKNRSLVIVSGNSALAKAGTGDVLSGMIGGLMAQGVSPLQAAATAAYAHGRMADEWVRSGLDKRSLMASDIRDQLPQVLARIQGGLPL